MKCMKSCLSYNYNTICSNALGTIYKTVEGNDPLAPLVASFSSRGPNSVALDILKVIL